jgi:GNAT superfamily N-acetyltransferase
MATMTIRPVRASDFEHWLPLWEGYNAFYEREIAEAVTRTSWGRFLDPGEPVHALVADDGSGRLVGLVHYLFHRNTAMIGPVTYLQDLFADPQTRGRGVGRALIAAVRDAAEAAGSPRVYWMTHETNRQARILYDKVAKNSGFIQYRLEV